MWNNFQEWLSSRIDPALILHFLEVSGQFPKGEYNALFRHQLEQLRKKNSSFDDEQLVQLHGFDWIGYIARSLRNAGFQDHDLDPMAHEIVVRLLVKPGTLFSNWDGQPISARFKTSVKNAVLNLIAKRQVRRKHVAGSIHGDEASLELPSPQRSSQSVIDEFREFLRRRLGEAAVAVLDQRLDGQETKKLIGMQGLETSYRLKQVVAAIKQSAREFGAGDEEFLAMVEKAMSAEAETMGKRFGMRAS